MTGVSESSFSFVSYNHPPPVNVRVVRILPECILVKGVISRLKEHYDLS